MGGRMWESRNGKAGGRRWEIGDRKGRLAR